jgi:hypothetical protein
MATKIQVSGRTAYRPKGAPKGKYFFTKAKAEAWERKNGGSSTSKRKRDYAALAKDETKRTKAYQKKHPAKASLRKRSRRDTPLLDVITKKLARNVFEYADFILLSAYAGDPIEVRIYGYGKDAKVVLRFKGGASGIDFAEVTETEGDKIIGGWYRSPSSWSGTWAEFERQGS